VWGQAGENRALGQRKEAGRWGRLEEGRQGPLQTDKYRVLLLGVERESLADTRSDEGGVGVLIVL